MAKEELKGSARAKKQAPAEITFSCQRCQRLKPIKEMRVITRFFPLFIVCQDCEKEL